MAAGHGEGKPRSLASSCAGQPRCFCTPSLSPHGWLPGGSSSPPPPHAPWTCSRVFGAERADAARGAEQGGDRLVPALGAETRHSSVHGPPQGTPPQPHCPATRPQPIATHWHSLPANPTLPSVPPFPLHLPPSLVLPPPTTIKQHPGLTNPGLPPGALPQPTTCRHLSLLLSRPSQQQLTNRMVREAALSQSGAATCQLFQPIRGSHTPPRGYKGPSVLGLRLCLGLP